MTVDDFLKEWHSEEPFVVAHTSGSTGKPKEIKLLKADMRASAALTNRFSQSTAAVPYCYACRLTILPEK